MAGPVLWRALWTQRPPSLSGIPSSLLIPVESVRLPPVCVLVWRTPPVRTLRLSSALCAGHNKWSKVKNIKGPKDEARGRMFAKFGMMIRIAVKEGGSNPELNVNLAHILEQCRSRNMPKASIETAIKNAEKAKAASQQMFEARGPGGCQLLIDVLTDNNSRCLHEIKRLLIKNGGTLSEGSRHNFDRKGVVVVRGENITTDRALELAIEAGAEDVQEAEDEDEKPILRFLCDVTDLNKVRTSVKNLGMEITSAGMEFVPHNQSSLDEEQMDAASTLIEALNDYPDVVKVWDNIQSNS